MEHRIEWIDMVKAASVLLVVFMHACGTLLDFAGPTEVPMLLQHINQVLEPMRMPLFFLVSGMLASSAIHRPWRQTSSRTLGMIYLYVLWMVGFMLFKLGFAVTSPEPIQSILFAKSGFWYLYAIALFFVIAKALRHQPSWIIVGVAVLPNLLRPLTQLFFDQLVPGSLATSIAMNLGFFLFGAYFKELVVAVAPRMSWPVTLVLGIVAVTAGVRWLSIPSNVGQSYMALSMLWIAFAIGLAVNVTRRGCPQWIRHVSARTLSIYLLQWPVMFLLFEFWPRSTVASVPAQILFPVLVTITIAVTAMWLQNRPALRLAFEAPQWLVPTSGTTRVPAPGADIPEAAQAPSPA